MPRNGRARQPFIGVAKAYAARAHRHAQIGRARKQADSMLYWAVIFFFISLVAGAFGFTNIAVGARRIAWILFALFLALAVLVVVIALALGALLF